ncbi:acetyl/propionyl/methylcrotonyl-CoA carboxylase subunit alpha [Ketobacter sp.]|uniref:acetyl/propionyl/methylcrotonyl-CoA carboxylase subunit alpha n=1 Tax=Ketobacter sp. TaxID=2083498 RepID=UPI000F1A34FE|nr:biotin carboxylase N-terminal domain-containing protein [Ketobacter sp.]RLU00951.1 MAG: ATP-grasp domain-containing protein [Ketobacter sp.]
MSAIKRLLVANRGEIACRVIRACKRLGIESVAVFSDADRHSQHVQQADMAVHIGGSAANESYLNAEAIIAAARKISADAIHPGYGFLSESTALISLCAQQDIIFVGPSVESIAAMGSKIEAKAIAQSLDIPTVPGYNGEAQDLETLLDQGHSIGFPLLIKASAGGGGKGMRIVHAAGEFEGALKQARQEALSAFGDDRVLLEKYIVRPRHIEVQLLGDHHGHVLHLLDRECSIQRNYQKVIEEAPVSHLDESVRQELFDCAVRLGQHLNYQGAGTVEFILDADSRAAYFLEMNTRLQVEHPTTEMVTGLDLVEWQIRVARGEPLAFTQDAIHANGHAIEARVNAEDPANDYLPEIGTITLYREPVAEGLRIDSGVAQGSEITPFYDSMVAKIIAHGGSRGLAAQRLLQGLNHFAIGGVKTNQEFLTSIITRPAFHQELSTQYLAQQFPNGWQPWGESMHAAIAAAACALQQETLHSADPLSGSPWQSMGAWRLTQLSGTPATSRLWLQSAAGLQEIRIQGRQGHYQVSLQEGQDEQVEWVSFPVLLYPPQLNSPQQSSGQWRVELEGTHRNLDIVIRDRHVSLSSPRLRRSYQFVGLEESQLGAVAGSKNAGNEVRAAMPGLVTDVLVQAGDVVSAGATAAVMEAMKLIHNLPCPVSGVVKEVRVAAGDKVEDGALLITIEPATED